MSQNLQAINARKIEHLNKYLDDLERGRRKYQKWGWEGAVQIINNWIEETKRDIKNLEYEMQKSCKHHQTEIHEYLEGEDGFVSAEFCTVCESYL